MLKELTLKNFKLWKSVEAIRLAPITGLFGTNSSGKSSILQALLLLKQTLESSDRSLPLHLGGERDYVELGSFRDVIWAHKEDALLSFAFRWELAEELAIKDPENPTVQLLQGKEMTFVTEIDSPDGEKLRVHRLGYKVSGRDFALTRKEKSNQYQLSPTQQEEGFRFIRTPGRSWDLPAPFKFHGFPDQAITYYQNSAFLPYLQHELEEQFSRIYYLGPLREYPKRRYVWSGSEPVDVGRRGERAVDAILAARERNNYIHRGPHKHHWTLDRMLAHWLKEMDLIHDFSVDRVTERGSIYEVRVQKEHGSASVLLTDVGFGVSQVLPVLVLCYYVEEGSTLLFEQPEIHLHPSVQSSLADLFIDVTQHRNIQIIVESHSEHLLNRLQRRMAEERVCQEDLALYFCKTGKNEANLVPLETDLFGNIKNWPKDFFGNRFGETAARQEAALQRRIAEQEEGV